MAGGGRARDGDRRAGKGDQQHEGDRRPEEGRAGQESRDGRRAPDMQNLPPVIPERGSTAPSPRS